MPNLYNGGGIEFEIKATNESFNSQIDKTKQKLDTLISKEKQLKQEQAKLTTEYNKATKEYGENSKEAQTLKNKLDALKVSEAKLGDEIDKKNTDLKKSTAEFLNNTKAVKTANSGLEAYKTALLAVKAVLLSAAAKKAYEWLIVPNTEMETYITQFDTLLGSYEKATRVIDNLNQFAAKTPLQIEDLIKASKQLLTFGTSESDLMEKLQQLGDLSQGQADILDRITLAYGKMNAKGKVSLEELNMMTEAGIPIVKELAKQYGISNEELYDMISKGKLNINDINKAMESMTSEGGQFFKMLEKQSQTASGMLSTLQDNLKMIGRDIGTEAYNELKGYLSDIINEINRLEETGDLDAIIKDIGGGIKDVVVALANAIKTIYEYKEVIAKVIEILLIYKATTIAVTVATTAFKNPLLLLASAIGIVTASVINYKNGLGELTAETESTIRSVKTLNDSYNKQISEINKNADSVEDYIKELEDLQSKESKTIEDKEAIKDIIDKINQIYPSLHLMINEEGNVINQTTEEIKKYNQAQREKMMLQSKKTTLQSMLDEQSNINSQISVKTKLLQEQNKQMDIYKKNYEEYANGNKSIWSTGIINSFKEDKAYFGLSKTIQQNKNDLEALKATQKSLDATIEEMNKDIDDSTIALRERNKIIDDIEKKNQSYIQVAPVTSTDTKNSGETEAQKKIRNLKYAYDMGVIDAKDYYNRLNAITTAYYTKGSKEYQQYTLEIKKGIENLKNEEIKAIQDKYNKRLQASESWIEREKHYNRLSLQDEIDAYNRILKYTDEAYKNKEIDYDNYIKTLNNINKKIYTVQLKQVEDYKSKLEAQYKEEKDEKIKLINDYYDEVERAETEAKRKRELSELQEMEELYEGAVTREGQNKLKEIKDKINDLEMERVKENRELEKADALNKIEDNYKELETSQNDYFESIKSGAIDTARVFETMTTIINNSISNLNGIIAGIGSNKQNNYETKNYNNTITNNNYITDNASINGVADLTKTLINNLFSHK